MYPILLFRDTFAEDANLVAHTPTPNGGPAWEYDDVAGAYTCHAAGYLDGPNAAATAPARNDFVIPVGVTKWRMQIDITMGGVDWVGGGFVVHALLAPGAIASHVVQNCLVIGVARRGSEGVQFSVQFNRPASPPGPAFVTLRSADIVHLFNTARRYICEVDQAAGICTLLLADAVTGANEMTDVAASDPLSPPTGDGLFTPELAAHIANDTTERLIGLQGGWSASGQVYFAGSDFRVYELEVLPTGRACKCLLQVFDDDRTTVLWEVSTDELHARPYLLEPSHYGEQQIDVAAGGASVGDVVATVIDLAQIIGDQNSGYVTALLAAIGVPDLGGRRCRFIRFDPDGDPVVIVDGPAGPPRLNDDYASFSWGINDTRDTEGKISCFGLIHTDVPAAIVGATPAGAEETGTDPGFTWGTEYH